jgi:hypothetical protein
VLFTWQQRFESLALGFESSCSPAKFAKRFESSNPDSRIRLTTSVGWLSSLGMLGEEKSRNEYTRNGVIKRCVRKSVEESERVCKKECRRE